VIGALHRRRADGDEDGHTGRKCETADREQCGRRTRAGDRCRELRCSRQHDAQAREPEGAEGRAAHAPCGIDEVGAQLCADLASAEVVCDPPTRGVDLAPQHQLGKQPRNMVLVLAQLGRDLLHEPVQAQTASRAPIQCGHGVRLDPELGSDLRPRSVFDLGQPEDALPAFGEGAECFEQFIGAAPFGVTFDYHAWRSLIPISHSISLDVYDKDTGLFMWNGDVAVQALEIMKQMMPLANPDVLNEGTTDAGVNGTPDEQAFASQQAAYYVKYQNAHLRFSSTWEDPKLLRLAALPKTAAEPAKITRPMRAPSPCASTNSRAASCATVSRFGSTSVEHMDCDTSRARMIDVRSIGTSNNRGRSPANDSPSAASNSSGSLIRRASTPSAWEIATRSISGPARSMPR